MKRYTLWQGPVEYRKEGEETNEDNHKVRTFDEVTRSQDNSSFIYTSYYISV